MSSKNQKPELLSPAGDLERLKYALAYGADAVYCGLPDFSLRAKTGFDLATLREGVTYAHRLKKKVYLTVNIFAHNNQIKQLKNHLKDIKAIGPDAIIISDPGVLLLIRSILPKLPIFLSTQANVLNSEAVKFWHKQGVKRIILGREANLQDIKEIHQAVPRMELEIFVHGAMCLSYSGRCYLSAWLNGRSANEGLCTQPCRWEYNVYLEEKLRPGKFLPVEEDHKGMYFLNSHDLCLIDHLKELRDVGVCSFKIEGRTKSVYYVAVATRAYRLAIDGLSSCRPSKEFKKEIYKIENRGYTTGFLLNQKGLARQNFSSAKTESSWKIVGQVIEIKKSAGKQRVYFRAHNVIRSGEALELLAPRNCYRIKLREIFNEKDEKLKEAHGGTQKVYSFILPNKINPKLGLLRKKYIC
ncbi:MAG: U32 family peptidase C-terminal domain-containing protein [Patescibacteria group bacterium]